MKKLMFLLFASVAILACTQNQPAVDDSASKSNDSKMLYEKNLATVKAGIKAFENEDLDGFLAYVADNAVYLSPAYGAKEGTKEDYKNQLSLYLTNWDSLKLMNPIFLPGLDSATHEFDGSVRYYGKWTGVHKSGVKTVVNFYATYEFNADNKIISATDYFDLGGLINAVSAKTK